MSYAFDSHLNSIRDFARGKSEATLDLHPFDCPQKTVVLAKPQHPAGYSAILTNKLPRNYYDSLGCKYNADSSRNFLPLYASQNFPLSERVVPEKAVVHKPPRPRQQLRVNETALGLSLGGKRQLKATDVTR